jgi:hypothetical protein
VVLRTTFVVAATLVVAGVAGVALVASSADVSVANVPTVARQVLQSDIADRLAKEGQPSQSVTCREDLVGQVGKTARCDVVMSEEDSFEPVVTVTSVDGSTVDYEMAPALSQAQLEKAVAGLIAKNSGGRVDSVACESGLAGTVGAVAHCDVDAGGEKARRSVRVTAVSGLTMDFNLTSE